MATTPIPAPIPTDEKVTDRFNLTGKTILITGGGRGIGLACAKAIAQLGGNIAVIDTLPTPDPTFQSLSTTHQIQTFYTAGDVTSQPSLESAFQSCISALGPIHGALTAAGICIDEPVLSADWAHTKRQLEVNVLGTFWTIKLLASHMVERGIRGSVVTIASVNAQGFWVPVQPIAAYNASKAAIKGLVGPLAGELGPYGIRVNCLSPGAINTPLLKRLEGEKRAVLDWYTNGAPLGRLGVPEDLTPMVCYLLSDASMWTTGADMLVTGGLHVGSMHTGSS